MGVCRNRDSEPIYYGLTACCEASQRQVQYTSLRQTTASYNTIVAGERLSLLMVGNNDEVYDKKPQRYAEDNVT